jgi:hypothetical protein
MQIGSGPPFAKRVSQSRSLHNVTYIGHKYLIFRYTFERGEQPTRSSQRPLRSGQFVRKGPLERFIARRMVLQIGFDELYVVSIVIHRLSMSAVDPLLPSATGSVKGWRAHRIIGRSRVVAFDSTWLQKCRWGWLSTQHIRSSGLQGGVLREDCT